MKRALLVLCLAAPLAAARLETSVDPREVRVGDALTLTVTLSTAPGETPLPFAAPGSLEPFEVVRSTSTGSVHALTLRTFEVDIATIPALTFSYRDAKGATRTIETPPIPIAVKSVLPKDAKGLKGLKGRPARLPWNPWPWAAGALIGAALTALFLGLRSRRKRAERASGPPRLPPDEEALRALDRLDALMDGPAKPYYSRLTDTIKLYIERRFDFPALDRTTTELIPLLKGLPVDAGLRSALRELLETADLAKFARFESPAEERARHRARARELVEATKPSVPPSGAPVP